MRKVVYSIKLGDKGRIRTTDYTMIQDLKANPFCDVKTYLFQVDETTPKEREEAKTKAEKRLSKIIEMRWFKNEYLDY